jgi:uncharacterized protein YbaP (TraB family)
MPDRRSFRRNAGAHINLVFISLSTAHVSQHGARRGLYDARRMAPLLRGWRARAGALALVLAALVACAPAPAGPALWRISDSHSEIWLFGTVHILPPTLKWEDGRIASAFKAADIVYFETPLDAPAQADIGALVARYGYNQRGVTLSSQLSAEDRVRLIRVCARFKLDPVLLEPARPWLAGVQLSVAATLARGQATQSGVDQVLDRDAQAQHKTRAYFETAEQQVRFFADLPRDAEVQFLRSTLREIEQDSGEIDTLDQAWAHGDIKAITRDVNDMIKDSGPDIYAALIRDRNVRWANEIDHMMKGSGKIFIAVGAAHMVGADGVPALLRKKGYKVEGP